MIVPKKVSIVIFVKQWIGLISITQTLTANNSEGQTKNEQNEKEALKV